MPILFLNILTLLAPTQSGMMSQVSGSLLQTAHTWANAEMCSASCAHALGSMFVCLFVIACLFVCLFVLQAI